VTNSTSDAGGQERGGPGGADPTAITGTSVSYLITSQALGANPTAAPAPTQVGIVTDCNQYSKAASGDTCETFASDNGITPDELYEWNTQLGAAGANCTTNLWIGYYYCIGTLGFVSATTTSSSSIPTSTSVSAPGPTQSGIISTCNAYAEAPSGSYCSLFASDNGISVAELYQWNTILGTNGANCGTDFWALEYYCVGVTPPTLVQAGIIDTCNNWAAAPSGSYCTLFASDNGITAEELYEWNTVLGTAGANCGSSFWADEYYCVGVTRPTLVQAGIIDTCNNWAAAPSGSYCTLFASDNGITAEELYEWNTVLGTAGANCGSSFWADEYYCIGVSLATTSTTSVPATTTATATAVAAPGPTQAGIVSNCNGYAEAPSGSYCSLFASDNGITVQQLYAYNTVLGTGGENCGTSFWANEYYCISVS
jgi:LysM repeat protein